MAKGEVTRKMPAERRRHKRVRLDLPGRVFVPARGEEARCHVADLSPGGATMACELSPEPGTQIVLYLDGFGRFEGQVVRRGDTGFAMRFSCTAMKRERVAEQLTLFLSRSRADKSPLRRIRSCHKGFARFTRADGEIAHCEVSDISATGVSLRTTVRPPLGEFVLIAQMAGRVIRHDDEGIAIEYVGQVGEPAKRHAGR
ncbi:MAG: PilZ domain-containing protein [Rhizomicrobium sp.]